MTEKINTLKARGKILFVNSVKDDIYIVCESQDSGKVELLIIECDRDLYIKNINDVGEIEGSSISISKFIITMQDDYVYRGTYKLSDKVHKFKITNGNFEDEGEFIDYDEDKKKFSPSELLVQECPSLNGIKNSKSRLTDKRYLYVVGQGQDRDENYIGEVFVKYDLTEEQIIFEKSYYSDKYEINIVNFYLTKENEIVVYGYKTNKEDERDEEIFIDKFLDQC